MKARAPLLMPALALAACAGVLAVALWILWGSGEAPEPGGDLAGTGETPPSVSLPGDVPAAVAGDPASAPNSAGDARVALVGEAGAVPPPQVEYELRGQNGEVLRGLRTALFRDEEFLGACRADESGLVHFDGAEGGARLAVIARHLPASVHDVSLAPGRRAVVLERGVAVSGRVRVAGGGAQAGVELILTSDRPMVDDSAWPQEVRKALDLDARDKLRLTTRTDEGGGFEFSGLGSPWSGRLEIGDAHVVSAASAGAWSAGNDTIRLDDPVEGLLIDVVALPLALGRVVQSPGGPAVARASVSGGLAFESRGGEDENSSASFDGRTDDDGRFELPVRPRSNFDVEDLLQPGFWPPLSRANLTLDAGDGYPRRRLDLGPGQFPERGAPLRFDFGEIVLERGATLAFLVLDGASQPLAGAVGRLDGERSEPTDERGLSSIAYAPGIGRPLSVSLGGYRDGRADLPAESQDPAEPLRVVLQRTTRLSVSVRSPDGSPVVDVPVQLSAQQPGGQRPNRRGNRANEQRTDGEGRAVFSDFPAEVPLRLLVRDALGGSAADQTVTLAVEEWRAIDVTLARQLLSFQGIVRDEQGLALAEAGVEFVAGGGQGRNSVSTRSDVDGRFSFSGLTGPIGTLRVRKTGFAPVTLTPFELPPPGMVADIRLERGMRLCLRIVDERGAPVRGESLRLELAGERPFQGRRLSENEWEFGSLPREPLVAVGMVGRREYRHEIEPLNGDQDFRVPLQGAVEISVRLVTLAPQASLRLMMRARNDRRVAFTKDLEATTLQSVRFDPVLPGDYAVEVQQYEAEGDGGQWKVRGQAQRVQVAEGVPTRLDLER